MRETWVARNCDRSGSADQRDLLHGAVDTMYDGWHAHGRRK
jgi:hypothetical protein